MKHAKIFEITVHIKIFLFEFPYSLVRIYFSIERKTEVRFDRHTKEKFMFLRFELKKHYSNEHQAC